MRIWWRLLHGIYFVLLLGSAHLQKLKVTGNDSPVESLVGEDVTIPCQLSGVPIPLNLLVVQVIWKQRSHDGNERQVYYFESFKHTQYRKGSHMADSDLQQGNMSLFLPRVQISDDGDYICFVVVSPDNDSAKSPLHVSVTPQLSLPHATTIDLSHESSVTISCDAAMFYPEAIKIRWVKQSGYAGTNSSLDRDTCARLPTKNSDGTFNVTSTVMVSPSGVDEDGDQYFCIVTHRALQTSLSLTLHVSETKITVGTVIALIIIVVLSMLLSLVLVTLYLWKFKKEKPTLSLIIKDSKIFNKEKAALLCRITGFRPKKLIITLYLERPSVENGISSKELVHSWKSTEDPSSLNSYNASGSLSSGGRNAKASAIIPLLEKGFERKSLLPVEMKAEFSSSDNGTYNCDCCIFIIPNADIADGANLTIEVQHPALTDCLSVQKTLQVIRFTPTVEVSIHKGREKDDINVHCSVKWTHPSHLYIAWLKMKASETRSSSICSFPRSLGHGIDGDLCHIIADIKEHEDHVSFSSILTLKKTGWKGAQFTCTIQHIHTQVWKTAEIYYRDDGEKLS